VLNDTRYHPGSADSFLFALTASNKASAGNGAGRPALLPIGSGGLLGGQLSTGPLTPAHTSRRLSGCEWPVFFPFTAFACGVFYRI